MSTDNEPVSDFDTDYDHDTGEEVGKQVGRFVLSGGSRIRFAQLKKGLHAVVFIAADAKDVVIVKEEFTGITGLPLRKETS